ncbi:MAG: OB-fold nucleic acid binding domain-containing protein [Candidatus Woesearchaeota archaeon]
MAEQIERHEAKKTRIEEINLGKYVLEEGWNPNYLLSSSGEKIFRVNLMAVVMDKEERGTTLTFLIDDGSDKIKVRSFEEVELWKKISIGDSVIVIGKIRAYNNEKYISPEIIKKIDKKWLGVRSLELTTPLEKPIVEKTEKNTEEELQENNVLEIIKSLDKGEGAAIEEIKSKSKMEEVEQLIEKMLMEGEIFQNLPGRVKVL